MMSRGRQDFYDSESCMCLPLLDLEGYPDAAPGCRAHSFYITSDGMGGIGNCFVLMAPVSLRACSYGHM